MERVIAPAVKFSDGSVFAGVMHFDALEQGIAAGKIEGVHDLDEWTTLSMEIFGRVSYDDWGLEDGYITDHETFLTRQEKVLMDLHRTHQMRRDLEHATHVAIESLRDSLEFGR